MIWIGKGIATMAVWTGAYVISVLGLLILIGPILGLVAGVMGTIAIWCPEKLEKIF